MKKVKKILGIVLIVGSLLAIPPTIYFYLVNDEFRAFLTDGLRAFITGLISLLSVSIPLYAIFVSACLVVLSWIAYKNKQFSSQLRRIPFILSWLKKGVLIQEIHFGYLPYEVDDSDEIASMLKDQGWIIGDEWDAEFQRLDPYRVAGKVHALRAYLPKTYLDFPISGSSQNARFIEYIVKDQIKGGLYAKVVVKKEGENDKVVSINMATLRVSDIGPHGEGEAEWKVFLPPFELDGWTAVRLPLQRVVGATFGKEGWSISKLDSIRLRGQIEIAAVRIYGS